LALLLLLVLWAAFLTTTKTNEVLHLTPQPLPSLQEAR
jgi:hypothetical protein